MEAVAPPPAKRPVKLRYRCFACGVVRRLPERGEIVVYADRLITADGDPDIFMVCTDCLAGDRW